jgi:hypothetical protein
MARVITAQTLDEPSLPVARGPLSDTVLRILNERAPRRGLTPIGVSAGESDPYGLDLQLALSMCYELHYRGFAGIDPWWEWNPALLQLRARLEGVFLEALRADVGDIGADASAATEMDMLSLEPVDGDGPSYYLRDTGSWDEMREYFVHRSLYHLKEGDPHAWAIPRLTGQAKASFVAIEFDEYGGGYGDRIHQQLFADLLDAAGLDSTYLGFLDSVPAESLAPVNLMSMFGLHRALRGATIGHFAATEITSSPGSRRLAVALERMDAPKPCIHFYREHVEADAVHEQVVRTDVVTDLLAREPHLQDDVVFGIRAFGVVEERLAAHLMDCWSTGRTSLRQPLG